jgi:peptidoglycan/LPS O-acetylase OafA/YrhL
VRWGIWWAVSAAVAWSATLTIGGYAQNYLNHQPLWLARCNEMIYPFYIFHQTVIVFVAFYVVQWQAGLTIKAIGLLAISLPLTVMLCLVIYQFNPARMLLGVKPLAKGA